MKKIMIIAAAAMLSIVANAATVSWSASSIAEYGKTTLATSSLGYIGMLINADITSRDAMLTAFADGDTSLVSGAMIANSQTTIGKMMSNDVAGMAYATGAGNFGNSQTVNVYALIFNADNITEATHVYVTDVKTAATGANGQAANFAFGALTGTQNAANWQAVPEPTSGLLMLVGLAGLALRRRRA